jgi:outer membrane lipopolysaccharide assembly protein LptE/RlpB
VTFVLEVPGDEPASPQVIAASRNYSYDVNQVLGKSAEEQALRGTLAADLTRRVIRRIQARAGSVPGSVVELPPSGI